MGVNYYVGVRKANWPTALAFQRCLDDRGWAVKLDRLDDVQWQLPLDEVAGTLGLPILLDGEPIELEASIAKFSADQTAGYQLAKQAPLQPDAAYHKIEFSFEPVSIDSVLKTIGSNEKFYEGDRFVIMTFRTSIKERRAGLYVLAALIKCFDGFGFDFESGLQGRDNYADHLIADAIEAVTR